MRLPLVVGLAVAFLLAPAVAQASDASLKATVKRELTTLEKAEKKFQKVAANVDSDAEVGKLKTAAEKLGTAVERFHSKVEAEKADSPIEKAFKKFYSAGKTLGSAGVDVGDEASR